MLRGVGVVLLAVCVLFVLYIQGASVADCKRRGGTAVRGAVTVVECIGAKP